jgi:hypothetical protein
MKMTKTLMLGAVAAAALTANQNLRAVDFSLSDLSNRAVAASPRAREQFPWLARQGAPQKEVPRSSGSALSKIRQNRALAASPRMREEFPELVRAEQPSSAASVKSGPGESQLAKVIKNRALSASPRMREQFPELARGQTPEPANLAIEVAPIK